jgi:regulator of cell morphogenesis and NO signaling
MFELTSDTRVAELEGESPAMLAALMSTGIFREGADPDVTIGELCWDFGLNPLILLNTLARARATEGPTNIDVSELDGLTLTQVVENIESSHHAYLREALPVIGKLIDKVVRVHGSTDSRLSDVHALFEKLSADLENHMLHEEESLFQMVRDMEDDGVVTPTRCGQAVGGPIVCMENEHDIARRELSHLGQLTDNFAVPENACATHREMLTQLARFYQDMAVHMHKENTVLFPRALKAQAALRTGT